MAMKREDDNKMERSSLKRTLNILCFCYVFFFFMLGNAQSTPDIPDDNLSYPVLLVNNEGGTGSGFFYNKDGFTYLITARHVLFKETSVRVEKDFKVPPPLSRKIEWIKGKSEKEFFLSFYGVMSDIEKEELLKVTPKSDSFNFKQAIEKLYNESQHLKLRNGEITLFSSVPLKFSGPGINEIQVQLAKLFERGQVKYHPSQDVALITIGINKKEVEKEWLDFIEGVILKQGKGIISLSKDNVKYIKDVIVGNEVYAFGYPTSITSVNPWLNINLPLLRKGIVAGKNEALNAIILDCTAFYGNSGGLVLEVEKVGFNTRYQAIGIITNLVPYAGNWLQNSGYSIVVPMNAVDELIAGKM
jgi:hypothetical protein